MSAERRSGPTGWLLPTFVTAGTGDRSTAEEVIRQQINPIRGQRYSQRLARRDGFGRRVGSGVLRRGHPRVGVDVRGAFRHSGRFGSELAAGARAASGCGVNARNGPARRRRADCARGGAGTTTADKSKSRSSFSAGGLDDTASMPPELATPLGDVGGLSSGAGSLGGVLPAASAVWSEASSTASAAFWAHWPADSATAPGSATRRPMTR